MAMPLQLQHISGLKKRIPRTKMKYTHKYCCQPGPDLNMPPDVIETTFRVRYAETDQMGIVHHSSYVVWLEEGRSQWMRAHGNSYAQFEKEGLLLVVSELYLRYKEPARYDQRVTIRCWVESVRSRQIQFNYEVVDAESGAVFINGHTQLICLDREGNVTKIPDKWQGFFHQDAPAATSLNPIREIRVLKRPGIR
jgi:acyl-CoA thioester hydrolase